MVGGRRTAWVGEWLVDSVRVGDCFPQCRGVFAYFNCPYPKYQVLGEISIGTWTPTIISTNLN